MDEKDASLTEETSLINDEVLQEPSELESRIFKLSFRFITCFVIGLIVLIVIIYFSIEIDEMIKVINRTGKGEGKPIGPKYFGANIIETIYLFLTVAVIIFFMIEFRRNFDSFFETTYNNYPMLIVMIICGLVDVGYYIMHSITIFSGDIRVDQLFVSLSELLFCVGILPFVIICVCYTVRSENLRIKTQMVLTIVATMAGCIIIYTKRVCVKIERDRHNHTLISDNEDHFLYCTAKGASQVLELVDITFILIGLVFLIDPLLKLTRQEDRDREDDYAHHPANNSSHSFLSNISLIRYRWLTILISVAIVSVLLTESYMIAEVMNSKFSSKRYKQDSQKIFMSSIMGAYFIAIFYLITYYYSDISCWQKRSDVFIKTDLHFNRILSSVKVLYSIAMTVICIALFEKDTTTGKSFYLTQLIQNILLATQITVQAVCIDSVIHRHVPNNPVSSRKSRLFPPLALASINFSCMIISSIYLNFDSLISFVTEIDLIVYIVLKNIALPITFLNRLHGMVFFVNLSIQQWQEP